MSKQEFTRARPAVRIAGAVPAMELKFANNDRATAAWLMLAEMKIPAYLDAGADAWYPNMLASGWGKTYPGWDANLLPDITINETPIGYQIVSSAMCCEISATVETLWQRVFDVITEYRDRVEADCWEVPS